MVTTFWHSYFSFLKKYIKYYGVCSKYKMLLDSYYATCNVSMPFKASPRFKNTNFSKICHFLLGAYPEPKSKVTGV
jgi:hypothetical protein